MRQLKTVRITHQRAPVAIRGRYALSEEERATFYLQLRDVLGIQEALLISTCNRLEVYYVHDHDQDLAPRIVHLLSAFKGVDCRQHERYFEIANDHSYTVELLYRVSIGLDSQVLGDQQIYGQVKQAYQESVNLGFADTYLHRIMHSIFSTHKQVCQETEFKKGAASVAYNALKPLANLSKEVPILVVGAGKMGSAVCRNLVKKGYTHVTITNRSTEHALQVSRELELDWLPYSNLFERLSGFNVLIAAVSSPRTIFNQRFNPLISHKFYTIDLCSPEVFSMPFLNGHSKKHFNIDSINTFSSQTLDRRSQQVAAVEAIIRHSIDELNSWTETYQHTHHLKRFRETLDKLRKEAMAGYLKKADPDQHEVMEDLSKAIIDKIVKLPAIQLKQSCQREHSELLGTSLNALFNIDFLLNQTN